MQKEITSEKGHKAVVTVIPNRSVLWKDLAGDVVNALELTEKSTTYSVNVSIAGTAWMSVAHIPKPDLEDFIVKLESYIDGYLYLLDEGSSAESILLGKGYRL